MRMLRLSKLTDYGTVIMAYMARQEERVLAAPELAVAIGVATPTASKILKLLARGGLLRSVRGATEGYMLSRPASEISIAQVIDAMEGPIGVTECSVISGLCAQEGSCSIRANWQRINRVIRDALDQMTLAELAQPAVRPAFKPLNMDLRRARPKRALA